MIRRVIPVAIAIAVGLLTFTGLLLDLPQLSGLLLRWATFLAAVALLLGVLNLFAIHLSRLVRGNPYSGVLVVTMLTVFGLAVGKSLGLTSVGADTVFSLVQMPLEMALASLLAFFLLFAGFQMLRRQRTLGAALFIVTVILVLLGTALPVNRYIPEAVGAVLIQIRRTIDTVFVTAGMRGILIGVALGTITLSIRVLVGVERPYNK